MNQKCQIEPRISAYHQVRHYIGRLGSWHRASATLVKIAVELPELLAGLTLDAIPQQPLACGLSTVTDDALAHLVAKLQLGLNADHVLEKLQVLYDRVNGIQGKESQNVQTAFVEKLEDRNLKPLVHPEALIVDYIFNGNLRFIRDDRYIGCSKPSCISCYLYLEAHPANILLRPCHGHLWTKWCPPYLVSQKHTQHTTILLQHMTLQFRGMVLDRLMGGRTTTKRFPESSTGITRSAMD